MVERVSKLLSIKKTLFFREKPCAGQKKILMPSTSPPSGTKAPAIEERSLTCQEKLEYVSVK